MEEIKNNDIKKQWSAPELSDLDFKETKSGDYNATEDFDGELDYTSP